MLPRFHSPLEIAALKNASAHEQTPPKLLTRRDETAISLRPPSHTFRRTTGRVRTKTVKKASRVIIEKYYNRLTLDFDTNKRVAEEVAIIQSKRLRNKIAGFTTHLMKRIQRGPVRGISLKLQEEERERHMDYIPDQSAINLDNIEVDKDTMDMLRSMNMAQLPGVSVQGRDGRQRKTN